MSDAKKIDRIAMSMCLEDGNPSSAWRDYRRAAAFFFFSLKELQRAGSKEPSSPSRRLHGGLEWRYNVSRQDGYPCRATDRFPFIPNISNDPDAIIILRVYAELIRSENSKLAEDMVKACDDPANDQPQHQDAWRKV